MRTLRLLSLLAITIAAPALAGENRFLGTITGVGSSLTNLTTAVPFAIPAGAYLTIQCDAAFRILVDSDSTAASGSNTGLPWSANVPLPTSVGRAYAVIPATGSPTAVIAVLVTGSCQVWVRSGNE